MADKQEQVPDKQEQIDIPDVYVDKDLHEPYEDYVQMNHAVDEFIEGVKALRKKHGIQNFLLTVDVIDKEGLKAGKSDFITCVAFGDFLKFESMAAYQFGRQQFDRQRLISRMAFGAELQNKEGA